MAERRIGGRRVGRIIPISHTRKNNACRLELHQSVQDFLFAKPYYAVFRFLIPLLVTLLQVCVQSTNKSPFETHPGNMLTFLVATVIYCLAFVVDLRSECFYTSNSHGQTYYSQLFGAVAAISGSISSISLVSVILPCSLGYFNFILGALVATSVACQHAILIKHACNWFCEKIKKSAWKLSDIWNRFIGNNSTEQQRVSV